MIDLGNGQDPEKYSKMSAFFTLKLVLLIRLKFCVRPAITHPHRPSQVTFLSPPLPSHSIWSACPQSLLVLFVLLEGESGSIFLCKDSKRRPSDSHWLCKHSNPELSILCSTSQLLPQRAHYVSEQGDANNVEQK